MKGIRERPHRLLGALGRRERHHVTQINGVKESMSVKPTTTNVTDRSTSSDALSSPATWDKQRMRDNLVAHFEGKVRRGEARVPVERLIMQVGRDSLFQDLLARWDGLDGRQRVNAWRDLLRLCDRHAAEVMPTCIRCGECCRHGSPTLQTEDLDLLRANRIALDQLVTLRRGEPVQSQQADRPFFLLDERIKIREGTGTQECVFLDSEQFACRIYQDRPVQCRAQACWDSSATQELAQQPYLTRRDLFADVPLLLDLIKEHDQRCAFARLDGAIKKLAENGAREPDELLELLNYEEHFRDFVAAQLNIPEDMRPLVFGRSFADLLPLYGITVRIEADGSRVLVAT